MRLWSIISEKIVSREKMLAVILNAEIIQL
jgi:hypothetical protein